MINNRAILVKYLHLLKETRKVLKNIDHLISGYGLYIVLMYNNNILFEYTILHYYENKSLKTKMIMYF